MDEIDVLVVGVRDIGSAERCAVICYFDAKEEMRDTVRVVCRHITCICERLRTCRYRRRCADADLPAAAADIDSAAGLMHVDGTDLPDRSRSFRRAVSQSAVIRPLDHRHGRRQRPVE